MVHNAYSFLKKTYHDFEFAFVSQSPTMKTLFGNKDIVLIKRPPFLDILIVVLSSDLQYTTLNILCAGASHTPHHNVWSIY